MIPMISVVGPSGCGKTTYLEQVVAELKQRRYRVAVIKHTDHYASIDIQGKDTWRYAKAGADVVCLASPKQLAVIHNVEREIPLAEILPRIDGVDLILIEGYKWENNLKIEIFRAEVCATPLCRQEELLALVSDSLRYEGTPHFSINDPGGLAEFLSELIDADKIKDE